MLTKAQEWVREQGLSPDDDLSYLNEFEHITLARVLIAAGKTDRELVSLIELTRLLERLLQAAEAGCRMGSVIEILVLQALALQAQGNIPSALASLERALTLAEPEGYVRVFVAEGKPMAELFARIEAKDGTPRLKEYILKLLSAFDLDKEIDSSSSASAKGKRPSVSPQSLISPGSHKQGEPLSKSELEVLKLLRSELSGPEIARDRMVSLSTIRTHTQRIYAKLGVNNRRAAVRRAEELDLL